MAQSFLARVSGKLKQIAAIAVSAGAGDAGKIIATDSGGKLDSSFLPSGIGANQVTVPASEALSAGNFVNLHDDAGTLKARKADNSNNRPAHGYVEAAVTLAATATVKRLNTVNANLSGLTPGVEQWLGTAGGVISTPLDSTDVANAGKACQYLGIAKSATELVTVEEASVLL
jgi:hypothetical protein